MVTISGALGNRTQRRDFIRVSMATSQSYPREQHCRFVEKHSPPFCIGVPPHPLPEVLGASTAGNHTFTPSAARRRVRGPFAEKTAHLRLSMLVGVGRIELPIFLYPKQVPYH